MKQNIYDDPVFFEGYSQMPRSLGGLAEAGEWGALRSLLPDLHDKRVLDLGCGFGWHCRYAREQGASSVVGVDLSANMLARAAAMTDDPAIEYRQMAIEDIDFADGSFDVAFSSLAFHYVERFDLVCLKVRNLLSSQGAFVMSVEHPVFTARPEQDWYYGAEGERLHWPLDHYQDEGRRHASWLVDDVVKYHRTVSTYINTLIESGFSIASVLEPGPPAAMLATRPDLKDESRRPIFLLISARV